MKFGPIIFLFLLYSSGALAGFFFQNSTNYSTDSDNSTDKFSYNTTKNITFLGGEIGKKKQSIIGQNIGSMGRTDSTLGATATTISTLEVGPRYQYFFDELKTFYFSVAYNIYVKGTRQLAGVSEEIRGSSYHIASGYHFKISRSFYLGFSMNYYSLALTSKTVGSTETKISDSYSSIFPAIEFSLRFN